MLRVVRFLSYDRILLVVAIFYHWHTSPVFLVSTHMCMSRMLTSHEGSSRRSRDGRTGISLGESHSLLCHPVYIRRVDIRLAVASQIAISHVVTQYEENVGRGVLFCTELGRKARQTYPCKPYCLVHINVILFGFFTHLLSDSCDRLRGVSSFPFLPSACQACRRGCAARSDQPGYHTTRSSQYRHHR